ncbi:MAG: glycosyltransferase, partial [Anaerolineales bacterium]
MSPRVSVIVPCYNEAQTISLLLSALNRQTVKDFEIVAADGMSEDGTRQAIREFASKHPEMSIRVVDNPKRTIPSGLNLAIADSQGEILLRLDAHSIPDQDYIERCLEILQATGAANVGGVWEIRPLGQGWLARGIA